jgi:AcrR family transcriptional regulator
MSLEVASKPKASLSQKVRILLAAAELVDRNGFHAVSILEIGATAGITGPAIYRHFDASLRY